eukprot:1156509-Pelagomonas_calceolata.AAC.5
MVHGQVWVEQGFNFELKAIAEQYMTEFHKQCGEILPSISALMPGLSRTCSLVNAPKRVKAQTRESPQIPARGEHTS